MAVYAKRLGAALLVAAMLLLTSCEAFLEELEARARPQPSETVERLEDALNAMDVKAALNCFDPELAKVANFALDVFGGIFGEATGVKIDFKQLVEIMPFFFKYMPEVDGVVKPSFKLETISTDYIDKKTAVVTVEATVTADGDSSTERGELTLFLKDGRWYIEVPKEVVQEIMGF